MYMNNNKKAIDGKYTKSKTPKCKKEINKNYKHFSIN